MAFGQVDPARLEGEALRRWYLRSPDEIDDERKPTERAKAVCNETATERRVWCDSHDGEIGTPRLFTARRKSGRPWP